jgi:hypothetical protein
MGATDSEIAAMQQILLDVDKTSPILQPCCVAQNVRSPNFSTVSNLT